MRICPTVGRWAQPQTKNSNFAIFLSPPVWESWLNIPETSDPYKWWRPTSRGTLDVVPSDLEECLEDVPLEGLM